MRTPAIVLVVLSLPIVALAQWQAPQPSTRELERINWMELAGLYKAGQGQPKFDAEKAKVYFRKVCDKVADLVKDTIRRWDQSGL